MNDSLPLLSFCLFWPLLGSLPLLFVKSTPWARHLALSVAVLELLLTLLALHRFDAGIGGFQLQEDRPWISELNIRYQLGVDGISILFLPLTAWLTLTALLAGWRNEQQLDRFYLALMLWLESVTIGVFTALDLTLFFLFWELTLPPIFFLIGLWGIGAERRYAAMKYTLYMLFGGVPLLFAFLALALHHADVSGSGLSFSLPILLNTPMPIETQGWILGLLVLGFAVKAPLAPLHGWLPTVAMEAPSPLTALLLGLKLGVYGLLRFALPLAPAAAIQHRWLLAIAGCVTMVYAGLIALRQSNLRRLLAYASVSHVGLVLIGIASFTLAGVQGAVMQLVNFSLVASSLMVLAGQLQRRLGGTDLLQLGGLAKPMPRFTALFMLFAMSSIGVPLTNGFPAEFLMLVGTVQSFPALALVVVFSAVIAAAYTLNSIRFGWFGPVVRAPVGNLSDLRSREWGILLLPALLVLALGVYPACLLSIQETTLKAWLKPMQRPSVIVAQADKIVEHSSLH